MNLIPHQAAEVTPGKVVDLAQISTESPLPVDQKETVRDAFRALRDTFIEQQQLLYAEGKQKLLLIFQAIDAGGKDSTIRKLTKGVNPQGVRVTSFKAPSHRELAHDYLWRVHREVPAAGMIGIFNRSHYEDVLIARVNRLVSEEVWQARYQQINDFEQLLTATGTTVLKFFLHLSKAEQLRRFRKRLANPAKQWKFSKEDLHKREKWDDYKIAFEAMLGKCSTERAPWFIIPADDKWYRDYLVMQIVTQAMEKLDPQLPRLEFDPSEVDFSDH